MPLDIGAALRDGLRRAFKRNGILLMGVFLLIGTASTIATQTLNQAIFEAVQELSTMPGGTESPLIEDVGPTPFALPIAFSLAAGLVLALALLGEAIHIITVRTFVSDATRGIPEEFLYRNMVWATLNGFIGGIVVTVLILIGLVLLIIPGIFLAISFFFVRQEIAVRDVNFVDAMQGSWSLTTGNRIEIFGLAIILLVITLLASIPTLASSVLGQIVSTLTGITIGAITSVFNIAVAARAYDQLRAIRTANDSEPDETEEEGLTRADEDSEFMFEV